MASRTLHRLSARQAATLTAPGRHADGGGLYLAIAPNGRRRWVFMFRRGKKQTEIGFGSARDVTLARARTMATEARAALAEGKDPRAVRRPSGGRTFGECADALIDAMESGWRNEKHRDQWKMTLKEYVKPLRAMQVDAIGTDDVLGVLKPLWQSKPETASRLRGRIERVLDAAKAQGLRSGENPARWRGHLDHLLSKRKKLTRGHHPALPFAEAPQFMAALRELEGVSALALEFTILTAARSNEVFGAKWSEFDLDEALWTVPAVRMKAGVEHRVPLSAPAVKIAKALRKAGGDHVFPGKRRGKPLSIMAMAMLLRRMGRAEITVHGFRSTFRDWAGERTNFPREIAEKALAHTVGDETERAYQRGDLLDKRRKLMDAWAGYCGTPATGKVVAFSRS